MWVVTVFFIVFSVCIIIELYYICGDFLTIRYEKG